MTIIKHSIAVLFIVGLFATGAGQAQAQTYYTTAQTAQIASLQALIVQLQAQLAQMTGGNQYVGTPVYQSADVSVTTDSVNSGTYGSVTFTGAVAFNRDNEAKAWFEYGPTTLLQFSTPSTDLRDYRGTRSFTLFADAVQPGTLTYYRAAASDSHGRVTYGLTRSFVSSNYSNQYSYNNSYHPYYTYHSSYNSNFDRPEVDTDSEEDVTTNRAELHGRVDMNDADNGEVFFVYGEDENQVQDADREDRYSAVDTDGDYLEKVLVDSSFDGSDDFVSTIYNLDNDTDIYYRLCVGYESDDNDDELTCGDVEQFTTDRY